VWILPAGREVEGTLTVTLKGFSVEIPQLRLVGTESMRVPVNLRVKTSKSDLWWPRGYGESPLFPLKVTFHPTSTSNSSQVQEQTVSVGFRKARIVQDPIKGQEGLTFYIEVNNVPVFAKGANWIPADAFESRVNASVIRGLVKSAYDANMNTLRNWGGGIYQHDAFYQICDELGIMVWEEFMFACSMYPRDDQFLDTVQEEVRHQVLRLMHHPSLIIWSGNNENELALGSGSATGWYKETQSNPFRYVVDYNYLNTDTVYRTVHELDASRPWLPSSPSNGILLEEPYVERWGNPAAPEWGDVHFYDYTSDCTDVSIYPKPRFASEYGFQSLPNLRSMSEVSLPEDWSPHSPFMEHRQHHPNGNAELDRSIKVSPRRSLPSRLTELLSNTSGTPIPPSKRKCLKIGCTSLSAFRRFA
jgi:beta-mannosidase